MNERERAEEHLRVIRTLMERATIYRAISAPTALVGGLLSVIASSVSLTWLHSQKDAGATLPHFGMMWLAILALTMAANTYFVWRAARKRREPMISPSMKLALRALLPPMLAGALVTAPLWFSRSITAHFFLSTMWALFYGLALLATAHFAPRSLVILGWAFTLVSLIPITFRSPLSHLLRPVFGEPTDVTISATMGVTFGLFHLVYAALTWPRRAHGAEP